MPSKGTGPKPLEIQEHGHGDLSNAYVAGAANLPFAVLRAYAGSELPKHNLNIRFIQCPFTWRITRRCSSHPAGRNDHSRAKSGPEGQRTFVGNSGSTKRSGAFCKTRHRHRRGNCGRTERAAERLRSSLLDTGRGVLRSRRRASLLRPRLLRSR